MDLAGMPTTAGCPAFAYTPAESAFVVKRLIAAGAIPVGKTNLDQFATGLAGTRSPYGPCRNSFDAAYISGGSSSGSAVAVAMGLASFSLGTDTAGSGRVPAAFNNLIGLKPSCGRLSPRGVVPACRTLDTMSIFALSAEDAARVCSVAEGFDDAEPYSRRIAAPTRLAPFAYGSFRFGVPQTGQLQFFGNEEYPRLFDSAVAHLERLGGKRVEIDFAPFIETGQLVYEGPWVAERYIVVEALLRRADDSIYPLTRQIIESGGKPLATQAFRAQYRLQALRRKTETVWNEIDVLLTPTAGTTYRIDEMEADPVRLNSTLGFYTNFMNLLDLAGVAVPAGFTRAGLPFGVTLVGPVWSDFELLRLAAKLQRHEFACLGAQGLPLPEDPDFQWDKWLQGIAVAVCGAHLEGQTLNHQLLERGAILLQRTHTAAQYRLYCLSVGAGLVRAPQGGAAIEVEIWCVPAAAFGSFVAQIPAPLVMGKLNLAENREIYGFLCEAAAVGSADDITAYGGWRAYQASQGRAAI
jgi:allophanate hydrolase